MATLEKLTQDESGELHRANGETIRAGYVHHVGKIRTLVVANPCLDISTEIDKMIQDYPLSIPRDANAYVVSDFSGDTQHLRKSDLEGDKKFYSVFAIQFYAVWY
jgi:hypothetical protein